MKYQTYLAAALFSLTSVAAFAADDSQLNDQQTGAAQDSTAGAQSSQSSDTNMTTGGVKSDQLENGKDEHVTGQASSADQIEADTSPSARQANKAKEPSPEADRKTGEASSAEHTEASSTQATGQNSQSTNSAEAQDNSGANQQGQTAAGTQESESGYSAELKKCDALEGTEKQNCVDSAKKKPGKM